MAETSRGRDAGAAPPIGSLEWAEAGSGRLSTAERRGLLGPALAQGLAFAAGRLRLLLGLRRGDAAGLDLDALRLPDSKLVAEAEAEAAAGLTACMRSHSHRTFCFGLALARLDGVKVDVEHLYVTALLHDIALESRDPGACFAVRGARTLLAVAERAGVDAGTARELAEAIAHHITPGVGPELGPQAPLLQLGAMVDLTGARLQDLRPDFVDAVLARHPRLDLKRHLGGCWQAEARGFPQGRAAFAERLFLFSRLVGLAPYPE